MMRKIQVRHSFLFSLIFVLCIFSCVTTSPELELARQAKASGNLETAYNYYLTALRNDPKNVEVQNAVLEIRGLMTSRGRQEAAAMLQGAAVETAPLLRSALQRLNHYSQYDPEGTYLRNDQNTYKQKLELLESANLDREKKVTAALSNGQYAEALQLIKKIQETDPTYSNLYSIQTSYRRSYGAFLESQMKKAYIKEDMESANNAINKWMGLGFSEEETAAFRNTVKDLEIEAISKKYRKLLMNNSYYTAYLMILKSRYKDMFEDKLNEVRLKGAPFYLTQARSQLEKGNVSRAYLEAVKGLELDPEYPEMFEMHRDTRDKVLETVQKYVAITAFGSPQDSPDAGIQFSDALISYLFRIFPYGINIVERGKIDLIMEEQKRELSQVANILNVDLIVSGNVSLLSIDRQDSKSQSTVRVPVGETLKINPEYELYIQSGAKPEDEPPPPKMIKAKEFGTFTIDKGRSTIKGFSTVSVRIFDTGKGRITYAQEFNANYSAADDYRDALELAGMEGDPLDLPSNTEVKEKLRNQIIKQLADVVQAQFEKREKDFLENARYYVSRKENDRAINELAKGFLYCIKAKVAVSDPDFTDIRDLVVDLTEKDFIDPYGNYQSF